VKLLVRKEVDTQLGAMCVTRDYLDLKLAYFKFLERVSYV
jgi:hypothetical protein